MFFSDLPTNIKAKILIDSNLSLANIGSIAQVCREWNQILNSEEVYEEINYGILY